jgi:hypothetical protein
MAKIRSISLSNINQIHEIDAKFARLSPSLSHDDNVVKQLCELSLYEFVRFAWNYVEGENPFVDNWHIEAICDHLEAGFYGRIRLLIINIPPRCMKSLLCNVFFPAWCWLKRPHAKIFCLSGGYKLAVRDSVKCRQLITSEWYQKLWGDKFELSREVNTKERYANSRGGERLVKSVLGSPIGEGGHILIMDDINTSQDIRSKTTRDRTSEFIDSSFLIRQDNTDQAFLLNIQQRVHWEDSTAHLLEKKLEGTVHLMLPMEYKPHRACVTIPLRGSKEPWCDPRTKENELLWPNRFSEKHVARLKLFFGTNYNIESQLQQLPSPESGNIFRKEWFKIWKEKKLLPMDMIIQSWDTALSTDVNACESALTTWGIFTDEQYKKNVILLNVWTGRLEQPDLRKMIRKSAMNYFTTDPNSIDHPGPAADVILIEEASGGLALIQDLRSTGLPIYGFNPRHHKLKNYAHMTNKADRARLASIVVEQGLVWLCGSLQNPGMLMRSSQILLDAALACPTGKGQDIIDSFSQTMIWIRNKKLLHLKGEDPNEGASINYNPFYENERD